VISLNKKAIVNLVVYAVILIAVAFLLSSMFSGLFKLSIFTKKDVNMIQYAGTIPEDWDRPDIVKSATARFGGYEIITEKDSYGCTYSDWYCAANTCNGVQTGVDADGCPIFENNLCYAGRRPGYDPYENAYCQWSLGSQDGQEYYIFEDIPSGRGTACGDFPITAKCGTQQEYCYTYSCQSPGYLAYNVPIGATKCGGLKRDEIYCGIGCWARFQIKKDGVLLYDSVDKLKTEEVKTIPIGVTTQASMKTLCRYEETGEDYIPCIYEGGEDAGEYAPISYCEAKYGPAISCDDVLVDQYVTDNLLRYSRGQDLFLNYQLLKVQLNYNSLYDKGDCRRVENTFRYVIPDEAFNFTVTVPEGQVMKGNEVNVQIDIMNRWQAVNGELQVYFEVPTILSTPSTETRSKIIDIPQGRSTHTYSIPTEKTTDLLKVKPTLYILIPGSEFQGVNGLCYGQDDNNVHNLNSCGYVEIGTVYEDVHEIQIVPKITKPQKESSGFWDRLWSVGFFQWLQEIFT